MRHGAMAEGRLHRLVQHIHHVIGAGNPLVVGGNVHVKLVEIDVLLIMRTDQVVKRVSGDGEHGLSVALSVVETVQQMNSARTRGRQAHAKSAGIFRVAAGRESGGFLVPDLDEPDLVLIRPERLENSIDAVAGEAENSLDTPLDQAFHKQFRCIFVNYVLLISFLLRRAPLESKSERTENAAPANAVVPL